MPRRYDRIDEGLAEFVEAQPVFFVATAALGVEGTVNCSPKGNRDELRVLDEHRVAYLDESGRGAQTIAHLRENGRIVLMFCAFSGPPRIVRLHGQGRFVRRDDPGFAELAARFPAPAARAARAVIRVEVTLVSDAPGYGVPVMTLEGHRRSGRPMSGTAAAEPPRSHESEHLPGARHCPMSGTGAG